MNVLVTGGAGYIGSHTVRLLREAGHDPVIYDNLSTGTRVFTEGYPFEQGDIGDVNKLKEVFSRYEIDAVMNFASFIAVGESVAGPLSYYDNNVARTIRLLTAMKESGITRFIFSSSAAVYGFPETVPIREEAVTVPINPYGHTKHMVEQILLDVDRAHGIKSVMLRYFNAAGAHSQGDLGEDHQPETHLIPLVMRSLLDETFQLTVFGDDYDTPDGTCIRDYIHVTDLADAHVKALDFLARESTTRVFNLGNGNGFSVMEVIDSVRRVTGRNPRFTMGERRPGDPPALIASSERAIRELGWVPAFDSLDTIVETAWQWESSGKRRGY